MYAACGCIGRPYDALFPVLSDLRSTMLSNLGILHDHVLEAKVFAILKPQYDLLEAIFGTLKARIRSENPPMSSGEVDRLTQQLEKAEKNLKSLNNAISQ
jgi:glycerophosphoryl diester phosphodiesterase